MQETAKRAFEKMGQVKEKKERLKFMFCGDVGDDRRDLKTVEKDLTKSSDAKEAAYAQINMLNNEQKALNEKICRVTNQAATAERSAREKEDAYNRDQVAFKRRDELNEQLAKLADEDKELGKQIVPLRQRLLEKESDRNRMRDANSHAEALLSDELKVFEKDVEALTQVIEKIDAYVRSNKDIEIQEVEKKLSENADGIRDEEEKLNARKPEIEQLKKQVVDG